MIVSHFPHGPTVFFTLHNVTLRHDIDTYKNSTVSEQYPHLIFENFTSRLGERIRDVLKYLFPVPKEDSKCVMTFSNEDDFISFRYVPPLSSSVVHWEPSIYRHHVFVKIPPKQVQLAEVGPRFEMKREFSPLLILLASEWYSLSAYEIRLGTIEQIEAEREWVLSYYSRTAKKRSLLAGPSARPAAREESEEPEKKRSKRWSPS